jgi:DtxR family Mn-dependent transcriptional regulator
MARLIIRVCHIYLSGLREVMEVLQRLTRRQVDALRTIAERETPERGVSLKVAAASLGVRSASALGHLTPLEEFGLIARHRGKSRLTPRGRRTLVEYQRHHRVAENLFEKLGLSPQDTCAAALEVDLAISHDTVERICAAEGHPSICPHGQPISPCSARPRVN